MNRDLTVWLAVGALALLCLALLVLVLATRRAAHGQLSVARAEIGELRARLDELEHPATPAAPTLRTPTEFLITELGNEPRTDGAPHAPLDRAAFADLVLRETVVKAASLAHGVRRGLAPATRNRIRFEMKQEVRRSRKQRRAELKADLRERHARQRASLAEEAS